MKNVPEWINSSITEAEEWISELEDRVVEKTAMDQNTEKIMKRNKDGLRDLRDHIKYTNIWIIGVLEEEKEEGSEKILEEIIVKTSLAWGKRGNSQSSPGSAESPI